MRKFDNWVEAYKEYTKSIPAPDKYFTWTALSVLAGVLERRTWIKFNKATVYPNMFVFLIGPSGIARKSSSSTPAINLIRSLDEITFMSEHLTQASLIHQISESGRKKFFEYQGVKYNNSSLYLYTSEAINTFKETSHGSIPEILTDFYDCLNSPWSNDYYWSKQTLSNGTVRIYNPCVNVLACSTPDWLLKFITPADIKGGFASRVLFIVQRGDPGKPSVWEDEDENAESVDHKMRSDLLHDLQEVSKLQGPFSVEKAVKEAFNAFNVANTEWVARTQDDLFNSYYVRKPWHLLKLMQILSAAEGNSRKVTLKHFELASQLLRGAEIDMREVFAGRAENDEHRILRDIWDFMRTKETVTKPELLVKFHKIYDSKAIQNAVSILFQMGKLEIAKVQTAVGPYRLDYKIKDRANLS